MSKKWLIFSIVGAVSLAADLLSKWWAKTSLPMPKAAPGGGYYQAEAVSVIDGFWDWQLSYNPGSAFSMFSGQRVFLTIVGIIALVAVFWMVHKATEDQRLNHWALGLIAGGAVGNLGERIFFGEVTDFVVWRYGDNRWPTFNVADATLVIGVLLLVIDSFTPKGRARYAAQKAEKRRKKLEKLGFKPKNNGTKGASGSKTAGKKSGKKK